VGVAVATMSLAAGCASPSSAGGHPQPSPRSTATATLRGTPVKQARCPASIEDLQQLPAYDAATQPITGVDSITVCDFLPDGTATTVRLGQPRFAATLALLSRPDEKAPLSSTGPVACPAIGQVRLVVFARATGGSFLVRIPTRTGACGPSYLQPLPLRS
jgi:hypothetical protein